MRENANLVRNYPYLRYNITRVELLMNDVQGETRESTGDMYNKYSTQLTQIPHYTDREWIICV